MILTISKLEITGLPQFPQWGYRLTLNVNLNVGSQLSYRHWDYQFVVFLQNNVSSLDDVTYDATGFFITANYIDHILSCVL